MNKKLAIALALATMPILVGCGSSSSTASVISGANLGTTSGYPTLAVGLIPATMPAAPGSQQSVAGQTYGTMTTNGCVSPTSVITFSGSGAYIGGLTVTGQTFYSNDGNYGGAAPGNIAINISTSGIISGTLQLTSYEIQELEETTGASCISGIALVGNLYTGSYPGFEGYAALYINNSAHGFISDEFMGVN